MGDTIPYSPALLANGVAQGKSGQTHRSGAPYETRKLSELTSPTKWDDHLRVMHLLYERVWSFAMQLAVEHVSGLAVGVCPGYYRKADGTDVWFAGSASYALPDDTDPVYLYIDHATGDLADDTAWPADKTTFTPLALVTTAGGTVVAQSIRDARPLVMLHTQASSSSPTGTTGSTFSIDNDATVDGDRTLALQRTAALTAALKWVQAEALLRLYADVAGATLAPLDLLEVLISGTSMLDADGAAKVQAAVAGDGLAHADGVLSVGVDDSTIEIDTDVLRLKDGGITAAKLSSALADVLVQLSVPDATGASPRSVTIQAKDLAGNALAEETYLRVRACDDADGADLAANATIAVGAAGTLIRSETATKDLVCKTDASGQLTLTVTDATLETVYLLVAPTTRSRMMDCHDIGTVTFE